MTTRSSRRVKRKLRARRGAKKPSAKELERALKESVEQQAATDDILRVISSSPAELQPVFDAIAHHAVRLCDATYGVVGRYDGQLLHVVAHEHVRAEGVQAMLQLFPMRPSRATTMSRAVLERAVVHVPDVLKDPDYARPVALGIQNRSTLAVPMLRAGHPIGTISVGRLEPRPFSEKQIALLKTFADQAVIAIENVRLFKEVEARNRDLTEALEQQTATSEILRVISSAPTDLQPMLDAVAENAARVCGASDALIYRIDGDLLRLAAHYGPLPWMNESLPLSRGSVTGRSIVDRQTVHVHDLGAEPEEEFPVGRALQQRFGQRTVLSTPLLREGVPIGTISIRRMEVRPFSDKQIDVLKTFADQAVIAIENVRLFTELEARNKDLTVALDQQTATSEILRVISSSQRDIQPVFDAIVRSAVRLCGADHCYAARFDGELLHPLAYYGFSPEALEFVARSFPMRPSRGTLMSRVALTRAVVNLPDTLADPEYMHAFAVAGGWRSTLGVPMLRDGTLIGVIAVGRKEPAAFAEQHVELLKTFADQAVIAIENVRLFKELEARNKDLTVALEQQTATSEILRVISGSQTDVQPVFDTIVRSAVRLCDGLFSALFQFDGELIHLVAQHNFTPEALEEMHRVYPARPSRAHGSARAILERAVVHIPDVEVDPEYRHQAVSRAIGFRSGLFVPMLREGAPMGVVMVARAEAGPFSDNEIELLKTFADQAVIAIENVRLFKELEARNKDLTVALEQQTATSEILRVISSSPTDIQPVFDIIGERAERLCAADVSVVSRFDGELIQLVALHGVAQEGVEAVRRAFPMRSDDETVTARAFRNCAVIHIPDVLADPLYQAKDAARAGGYRGCLGVPMVREGQVIGVIFVARATPGYFADTQVELLKTFADQAVIAIENVRLFTELQARTGELGRSVDELKALGEVSQAVSSTLDHQTVLDTIVARAAQLSGTHGGVIYEYDEASQQFHLRATHRLEEELVEALRREPLRLGEGATGQAAATRAPFQVTNLLDEKEYTLTRVRSILAQLGYRSILAVPLIFEQRMLGALVVHRQETGAFAPAVVNLLQTFAAQSALAIQNARLFREIEDKGRQLEAASRHKSEFLANMSHELRTPLNAITGFSEVLLERMFGEINPKQTEYLQDILSSGRHLLSLINDILDLSKIEAGRMELTTASFHVPLALENAITLVKERAARHGIGLDIDVDQRLGEFVGDERKIKQVLLNLLSNAVKFTPEGGRIGVKAALADRMIEISISDTGIGIAPEDQEAIFEEFRQVGSDEARKREGTGLGLTLTKKFVEMHGGRIWVESEVGKGSTFRFTLPMS